MTEGRKRRRAGLIATIQGNAGDARRNRAFQAAASVAPEPMDQPAALRGKCRGGAL
jgi:hypothetical protein